MSPEGIAAWTAAVIGAAAVIGLIIKAIPLLRRIGHFLDDWFGEPARPGVEERPGVMTRLERVEKEVTYNDGTSLKDAVRRIELELGTGVDE